MSSFNLIKEFKLVRKKYEKKKQQNKIKNGFNVCFQNKANVPITIISCGVCLKPSRSILSLQRGGNIWEHGCIIYFLPIDTFYSTESISTKQHCTVHACIEVYSQPMIAGIGCNSACPGVDKLTKTSGWHSFTMSCSYHAPNLH